MIHPIRIPLAIAALAILTACGGASRADSAPADTVASEPAPARP